MTHLSNPRSRHSGKIYVDARISSEDDENAFTYVNPNFNADSLDENQGWLFMYFIISIYLFI